MYTDTLTTISGSRYGAHFFRCSHHLCHHTSIYHPVTGLANSPPSSAKASRMSSIPAVTDDLLKANLCEIISKLGKALDDMFRCQLGNRVSVLHNATFWEFYMILVLQLGGDLLKTYGNRSEAEVKQDLLSPFLQ